MDHRSALFVQNKLTYIRCNRSIRHLWRIS